MPRWMVLRMIAIMALVISTLALSAYAGPSDKNQPMNIEADALRYDDAQRLSVFTGHVVVTKGTILIRGDTVEVRQDPQGHQFGRISALPGQRAFFRQKRDGTDESIEGEAETIDYDGRTDTLKLATRAQVRRYQGTRLNDEFNAALIVYNAATDAFSLDGSPGGSTLTSGKSGLSGGGRVRVMLTPRPAAQPPVTGTDKLLLTPALGGASR